MRQEARRSTHFPYTTLFRSHDEAHRYAHRLVRRLAEEDPEHYILSRSEEHTSELQSPYDIVCRLLLEKKKYYHRIPPSIEHRESACVSTAASPDTLRSARSG